MTQSRLKTHRAPWSQEFRDTTVDFRMMTPEDFNYVLNFSRTLTEADLIYLRLDITQPEVVKSWVENVRAGNTNTIILEHNGTMAGYGSLHVGGPYWTRHHGEIRLLIAPELRGKGVGHHIMTVLCEIASERDLDRVIAQIPANQPYVREMLESIGFVPAALMTDWLKDRNGRTHDLVIMSKNT